MMTLYFQLISYMAVQVIWCSQCQCAVAWSLMTDAESPGTLFELLYLFFAAAGGMLRVVYDNACNFLNYALNRDPAWAKSVRVFIDALHFKGHTCCATSLDGGVFLELHPCSTTTSSLDGRVQGGRCLVQSEA